MSIHTSDKIIQQLGTTFKSWFVKHIYWYQILQIYDLLQYSNHCVLLWSQDSRPFTNLTCSPHPIEGHVRFAHPYFPSNFYHSNLHIHFFFFWNFQELFVHHEYVKHVKLSNIHTEMLRKVQYLPEKNLVISSSGSSTTSVVIADVRGKRRRYVFKRRKVGIYAGDCESVF